MGPLTENMPKPMLKVAGQTLIERQVQSLVLSGVTRIVINLAWKGDKIEHFLGDGSRYGVNIVYSRESQALETAGGIINALPLILNGEGACSFWITNGDVFTDFDYNTLPRELPAGNAHLLMVENPPHNEQGDFSLHGGVLSEEGSDKLTYSGISVFHSDFFNGLSSEKQPLGPLLRRKMSSGIVTGQKLTGTWCDVGTPERLSKLIERESIR